METHLLIYKSLINNKIPCLNYNTAYFTILCGIFKILLITDGNTLLYLKNISTKIIMCSKYLNLGLEPNSK